MNDLYPTIQYKITKSIGAEASVCDPSDFIVQITAEIFVYSESDEGTYVGKCNFYFVDIEESSDLSDYDPKSLLDVETATSFFIDLFDDTNGFSPEVEEILQGSPYERNMFIIDRVEIIQEYRGKGLAKVAIRDAITLFCGSANVVALKAYPLQMEARNPGREQNKHDVLMGLDKFTCTDENAVRKLGLFYESLGFKFIGDEGLMIKSC